MIGLIPGENFLPACELTCCPDCNLIGITSCKRENEASYIGWSEVIKYLGELGLRLCDSETSVDMMKSLKLVCDRIKDGLRDTIPKVVVNSLRCHVNILLTRVVIKVDAFTFGNRKCRFPRGISCSPCENDMIFCTLSDLIKTPWS